MENTSNYPEESSIDLRLYLALLRHWAWLLILAAILTAAAAFFYTRTLTPVYSASTTMLVNEAPSTRSTDYTSIITSERLALTYAEMMKKRPVVDATLLRLGIAPEQFSGSIMVKPVRDTQLLTVTVEDTDPTRAAQVSNTLVEVFSETIRSTQAERYAASKVSLQSQMTVVEGQIAELKDRLSSETDPDERGRIENRITQYEQSYNNLALSFESVRLAEAQTISSAVIIEEARVPRSPVRPNTMQNTMLAGIVGLMLAAGGVFLYEYLDDTIKDPEEITRRFGLPILAIVISHEQEKDGPITQVKPFSPVSEAFRSLRTSIHFASSGNSTRRMRRILVTSPTPSDGKTTVTANLAIVIAQSGLPVAVIDADMHRPYLHKVLQRSNRRGMSSLFALPPATLEEVLQPAAVSGLEMIGSGPIPPNPSELLGSVRMIEILDLIAGEDRTVVIDSPPVLSVTDAVLLSTLADGVVLVVKPGSTNMQALRQTVDQLRRVGANLIGIVLNDVPAKGSRYSYYTKGYYSYYHYGSNGYGKFAKNGKSKKTGQHLAEEIWNAPVAPRVKNEQD
jgi:capsular exopolysaccharide synthesis family protein